MGGVGTLSIAPLLGRTTGRLTEAITIDADPETVWSVLADTDRYREWNPLLRHEGSLRERARLRVRLSLADPVARRFERASIRGFRQMNLGLKRRAERFARDE